VRECAPSCTYFAGSDSRHILFTHTYANFYLSNISKIVSIIAVDMAVRTRGLREKILAEVSKARHGLYAANERPTSGSSDHSRIFSTFLHGALFHSNFTQIPQ
jgi:hypothetical protein